MLSRSNSNAGDRLRTAKSTSSSHTASSGHQRTVTSIDPFVTRQQAKVAAVEAYQRARQYDEPAPPAYRPVPLKPQRRRSQISGRTEGSHFEDARLGRRRSRSRKDDGGRSKSSGVQQHTQNGAIPRSSAEESVVTRKRLVIPPNSSSRFSQYNSSSLASSARRSRKSQSGYTDGSPVPRHTSTLKERCSTLNLHTSRSGDGYNGNLTHLSDFRAPEDVTTNDVQSYQSPRASIRETQTDEEILTIARDKCLQDFQYKKLRERTSLIRAPFQRRRATQLHKGSESKYDTTLPPFNYAAENLPPPPPPPPPLPADFTPSAITVPTERKSRNFSDSFKRRIKRVFRKSSRAPSGLPPQQVEAKVSHYPACSPASTPDVDPEKDEDPFTIAGDQSRSAVPQIRADSASSRRSIGEQNAAKSRVTSWTNSTLGGTSNSRTVAQQQHTLDEHGRLKRSDSFSTLRKATSFLGRPIKQRLRRPSKLDLQSSEESKGLYSALQERIEPSDSASQVADSDIPPRSRTPSALDTLPSQRQGSSIFSSRTRWVAPTIRSVTPDPNACKLDIPSPVTEVLSPDTVQQHSDNRSHHNDDHLDPTPRSQLQRRPAIKAPTPSKEQIARRIEKSKNRWQSPLDEFSPPAPRLSGKFMVDENPYKMRSLSRTMQQPAGNDLPHHAKAGDQRSAPRQEVLSPSVYSRATDGASPRPDTPVDQGGMFVTITGREVKSYSISPPKRDRPVERPVQASHEWRRWLSNEINGWDDSTAPQDFTLPKGILKDFDAAKQPVECKSVLVRPESASPTLEAAPMDVRPQRPRASSRRSSYMNERYPMIDSGQNSSDRSIKTERKVSSSLAGSQPDSTKPRPRNSFARNSEVSVDGLRPTSMIARQRVVSKHQSIAHLDTAARSRSALKVQNGNQEAANAIIAESESSGSHDNAARQSSRNTKTTTRPKSAFDLRANYKNSNTDRAKPVEVRRKANNSNSAHILEDTTVQNIAAGPYAADSYAPAALMVPADANKENTPPSEPINLPALSSSEWLAAGTSMKRDTRNQSNMHPAYRNRSVSRYSPSRTSATSTATTGLDSGQGGSSPGQRLVTNWLGGKRSKESSPAFV